MDCVPVQLSYLRRPVAFLLLAAAIAAVAVTWMRVVQTISEAKPVPAAGQATAIAWGDRVFASRAELAAWLRSRGTSYEAWSKTHQVAAGVVEHRPVKAAAPAAPVRQPQPAQTTRPAETTSSAPTVPRVHSAPQPVHKVAASKHTVPAAAQASGDSLRRRILVGMLVLLAAVCAWGAALPTVFRDRFPALACSVGRYRELFVTGAVALAVGLAVGVALN
jgi:hypothetical protein